MSRPNPDPLAGTGLNVIALVSGGKDSFTSLLHCHANGHRVVALANLYPPGPATTTGQPTAADPLTTLVAPTDHPASAVAAPPADQPDLNSFMYQTVGYHVLPLYAAATGLPLYRRPITGTATHAAADYAATAGGCGDDDDETESMLPLLRAVLADHPGANALCAGAILSTYQRTRVESVAARLGLAPLAYLWQFPALPAPGGRGDPEGGARLLADMHAAGLRARVVKVASAGLDEGFLWEEVTAPRGRARLRRAMARFGAAESGAVLGEGGEFETLVVDGPGWLFRKRIVAGEGEGEGGEQTAGLVVREGGGSAWLSVQAARLVDKTPAEIEAAALFEDVRIPILLGDRFLSVLEALGAKGDANHARELGTQAGAGEPLELCRLQAPRNSELQQWCVVADGGCPASIEAETTSIVGAVKARLDKASLPPTSIISTVIVLRHMSDFPTINKIYATLFPDPNPPSRVTISCGDLLPAGYSIALYLTVHPSLPTPADRRGLHVQSRSYWAPANIGPYSQAISIPAAAGCPVRLVHIAGQIALIPATMALPPPSLTAQLTLSLQHLWRVAAATGVQWWTAAAAYLPRSSTSTSTSSIGGADPHPRDRAILAARAWAAAHRWVADDEDDEDDEDEGGPDLWDRTFDPRYMSFAAGGAAAREKHCLPAWDVLAGAGRPVPFVFAAEVHELPRGADVEWHALAGLAGLGAASVRVAGGRLAQHVVVDGGGGGGSLVHSAVALGRSPSGAEAAAVAGLPALLRELDCLLRRQLADLAAADGDGVPSGVPLSPPVILYADAAAVAVTGGDLGGRCPVIPCASLWSGEGEQLTAVAIYQHFFDEA